jgi:hypothetical protein
MYYGFTLPNNPYDTIQLSIEQEAQEEQLESEVKKVSLLRFVVFYFMFSSFM